MKFSFVIPVYNKAEYTKKCIDHLLRDRRSDWEIIVLNNASSDSTQEMLAAYGDQIRAVDNVENLGCAGAWNQGVEMSTGEWIVVLNNDVLLPKGWVDRLEQAAIKHKLDIISPAIREGADNYDLEAYSLIITQKMHSALRRGRPHGICFMVKRSIFENHGAFDPVFKIGQYEDADFFRRCRLRKVPMAICGAAMIHHYGSLTQKLLSTGSGLPPYAKINRAYYRKKWGLNPIRTHWERYLERRELKKWRSTELDQYGHTLFEYYDKDGNCKYG